MVKTGGGPRPNAGRPKKEIALLKDASALAESIRAFLDIGAHKLGEAIPELLEIEIAMALDPNTSNELGHKIRASLIRLGYSILQPPEARDLSKAAQVMRDIIRGNLEANADSQTAAVEMVESTGFDTRSRARDTGSESDTDGDSSR